MDSVNDQIALETTLYVQFCRQAAQHDTNENYWRKEAHRVFYHIQELKSTGVVSYLKPVTR